MTERSASEDNLNILAKMKSKRFDSTTGSDFKKSISKIKNKNNDDKPLIDVFLFDENKIPENNENSNNANL